LLEDLPRVVETGEQWSAPVSLVERTEDLRARDLADPVGEPLDAEELATDRTGQDVMRRPGPATKERSPKAGPSRAESKSEVHELSTVASLRPRSVEKRKLRADSGLRGRNLRLFCRLRSLGCLDSGQLLARLRQQPLELAAILLQCPLRQRYRLARRLHSGGAHLRILRRLLHHRLHGCGQHGDRAAELDERGVRRRGARRLWPGAGRIAQ